MAPGLNRINIRYMAEYPLHVSVGPEPDDDIVHAVEEGDGPAIVPVSLADNSNLLIHPITG